MMALQLHLSLLFNFFSYDLHLICGILIWNSNPKRQKRPNLILEGWVFQWLMMISLPNFSIIESFNSKLPFWLIVFFLKTWTSLLLFSGSSRYPSMELESFLKRKHQTVSRRIPNSFCILINFILIPWFFFFSRFSWRWILFPCLFCL